ncbi:MAG TPA: hypothetical protein VFQ77_18850 [Pseudonocardiaceae bacterium]|nr:hypothetical protein [Pseudonocardiaceae bacterium]
MTYVQYPYATLISLGNNLTSVSDRLEGEHRGAQDVQGLDTAELARIQSAIEDFRGEWKTSLLELMTNIGKWGGLSKAIGQMVNDFDNQLATALRPGEGPPA